MNPSSLPGSLCVGQSVHGSLNGVAWTGCMDRTEDKQALVRLLAESDAPMKQTAVADALGWSSAETARLAGELDDAGRIQRLRIGRESMLILLDDAESPLGGTGDDSEIGRSTSGTTANAARSDSTEAQDEAGSETRVYDPRSEAVPEKRAETDTDNQDGATDSDDDSPNHNADPDFCTNCGTNVRAYVAPTFCPDCGASLQPDS